MDDQNNKKGYDEFFSSDNRERSDESTDSDKVTGTNNQEAKPAYYYSYGPMSNEPQQPTTHGSSGASLYGDGTNEPEPATERYQASSDDPQTHAQPPQLRPFAPSQSTGKNGWQVKEKRGGASFKSVFVSFLAGVIVVGGLMYTADVRNWFTPSETVSSQSETSGAGKSAESSGSGSGLSTVAARPDNIAQLFETASPAVVKIETYAKAQSRSGSGGSLLDDPFFRQFFGDDYPGTTPEQGQEGQDNQMQQTGIGTGFFFEDTGYILTNQHVIGEADEIRVTVQGYDKPFTAKLLGSSYDLDLAVVKVEGDKAFPTLPLGSSDDINIGDWVVAIGNPYGFDHTVTVGVLSAKERPIDIQDQQGERNYKHLLQTDASINPGNSGGPLLNVKGEVVGINTAVSSQAQGIGFAIPTSTIQEVLDSLKNNTEIPKEPAPFIGAELYDMTEDFAKQLGIEKAEGSLVKSVYYNSPAYLGDLKQFDVILGIDGKKLNTTAALIEEIQARKVGDKVQFNIIRQGKTMDLQIEIGDKNKFGVTDNE
ncbi:trypsin-like peptidase domain-containing protein [Paenibacillus sp. LHD-117]|uniref:trypsin-like peptidase domain-containing protein n=1 Tax=Paenibacillus sp. LHD-117 TaxID=3071412 RepID=UPI0027DF0764|nr:trypsin-like peptidase domain-containing protein [Paenibacillus sp. LHD-117]MDQ6419940.1 trypsin-like peptidase domain-containing protein [Paenibacillus sp. LHD-117]